VDAPQHTLFLHADTNNQELFSHQSTAESSSTGCREDRLEDMLLEFGCQSGAHDAHHETNDKMIADDDDGLLSVVSLFL
jgi:hypothetical protein